MAQKIEKMSQDDEARMAAQRKWVREHYTPEAQDQYETVEGKLRLLDTILGSNWIRPDETCKLQCLGITLGDVLVQQLGLKWMTVDDEYGRDPCLVLEGTSLVFFPLTMISKKVERGDDVDVRKLFNTVCDDF